MILIIISTLNACCITPVDERTNVSIRCVVDNKLETKYYNSIPIDPLNRNYSVTVFAKNNENFSKYNLNIKIECNSNSGWCENTEGSVFIAELHPNQSDSGTFYFQRSLDCKYTCIPVEVISYK
jgi:hypothetical protein